MVLLRIVINKMNMKKIIINILLCFVFIQSNSLAKNMLYTSKYKKNQTEDRFRSSIYFYRDKDSKNFKLKFNLNYFFPVKDKVGNSISVNYNINNYEILFLENSNAQIHKNSKNKCIDKDLKRILMLYGTSVTKKNDEITSQHVETTIDSYLEKLKDIFKQNMITNGNHSNKDYSEMHSNIAKGIINPDLACRANFTLNETQTLNDFLSSDEIETAEGRNLDGHPGIPDSLAWLLLPAGAGAMPFLPDKITATLNQHKYNRKKNCQVLSFHNYNDNAEKYKNKKLSDILSKNDFKDEKKKFEENWAIAQKFKGFLNAISAEMDPDLFILNLDYNQLKKIDYNKINYVLAKAHAELRNNSAAMLFFPEISESLAKYLKSQKNKYEKRSDNAGDKNILSGDLNEIDNITIDDRSFKNYKANLIKKINSFITNPSPTSDEGLSNFPFVRNIILNEDNLNWTTSSTSYEQNKLDDEFTSNVIIEGNDYTLSIVIAACNENP